MHGNLLGRPQADMQVSSHNVPEKEGAQYSKYDTRQNLETFDQKIARKGKQAAVSNEQQALS